MEHHVLEHILDGRQEPTNLPLALLKNITNNFSKDLEIGHGGFATVYKGVLPNRNVAVKRIMNNHTVDEKLFYREVNSLLTVNHPNIVRFLGFCASTYQTAIKIEGSRDHIYAEVRERLICFEYISNGNLRKHITDELRGLDWSTRYQLIKGICDGLHYLHIEKYIYHMDLKPANILVDNDMVPKITDFGLSRLDEKSQTMSIERHGTLGYCAPEYLNCGKMSFKSDIYSLGTIIIELVTGEKSIPNNNKNNVLRRWWHRWRKAGKQNPLGYQQVTKCIDIGVACLEIDPRKRPFIWEIVRDINEMEATNSEISNGNEYTVGQENPYSEDDMLGIEPLELHFSFELNKEMSCSLQLTNETDSDIAFEVQKMSPLPYCIEPHKGIVPQRSKCGVVITLQLHDKATQRQCANEFIVRSTKVNYGLTNEHITTAMFNESTGNVVDEVNLEVAFDPEDSLGDTTQPVDIYNPNHQQATPSRNEPSSSYNMEPNRNTFPQYAQDSNDRHAEQMYHGSTFNQDIVTATPSNYFQENAGPREARLDNDSQFYRNDNQEYSADGDPLPGIEGFQIVGDPRPGSNLTACGFPTNGTTLSNFQWVRYLEDGTRQSIEGGYSGATMYDYVVTADDVGTLLAVDCTPVDDNGRQGDLVRKFANDENKISCDPDMQNDIDICISRGRANFDVYVLGYSPDEWELATLVLRRTGYQINLSQKDEVFIDEKYSPNLEAKIPNGRTTQFVLVSSGGVNLPFNTQGITEPNSEDNDVRLRDLIVLVMRTFQNKALDAKRKGKA